MKLTKLNDFTYLVEFKTRTELCKTFLRFQEFYESPKFRGKIFTLKEFKKWYAEDRGSFSYYSDWSGFNIPSRVLKPFKDGKFGNLSIRERKFLNMFKDTKGRFYVIGVSEKRSDTLLHELHHAKYYVNRIYRKEVNNLLNRYGNLLGDLKESVLSFGYNRSVLLDEVHAYISASGKGLDRHNIKYPKSLAKKLQKLFRDFD